MPTFWYYILREINFDEFRVNPQSWFHEVFFKWDFSPQFREFFWKNFNNSTDFSKEHWHCFHSTVWKLRKFTITLFWWKFRESILFTKEVTKSWFHEIFCVEREFLVFPHDKTVLKLREFFLTHFWQKFRESNGFTKELIWRNIFGKRQFLVFF